METEVPLFYGYYSGTMVHTHCQTSLHGERLSKDRLFPIQDFQFGQSSEIYFDFPLCYFLTMLFIILVTLVSVVYSSAKSFYRNLDRTGSW